MRSIKFLILALLFILPMTGYAAEHPQAKFGVYGIKHFSTLKEYQQNYVGKVVKYLPYSKNGGYYDKEHFLEKGGKFETEYIISKITGNDKRMAFLLTEKNGKGKVSLTVNNQEEIYSYGKYAFCITDDYSIPLILSEKLEADEKEYVGKVYPLSSNSNVSMEVIGLITQFQTNTSLYTDYPKVSFVLKDRKTEDTYFCDIESPSDLNDLGITYTNPLYKCTYSVVNIIKKANSRNKEDKYYIVKNSIDGKIKEVKASSAQEDAFYGDNSGHFTAILSKVEKPSDSSDRYGKTTTVTDEGITKFSYIDEFLDILIFSTNDRFHFSIKNMSDNTLKLIWNEAVFVDVDGSTSKIMHTGIRYSQREGDQPASSIIKGAKLEDVAVPTARVRYSDVLKDWMNDSLYENAKKDKEGQVIKLMLPIQVKDVVNEYIFEFDVSYIFNHPEYLVN